VPRENYACTQIGLDTLPLSAYCAYMEKEAKVKSMAGSLLARLRWAKATPEEKAEVGKVLAAGRKKARRKRGATK
jgi:hypothetical protein